VTVEAPRYLVLVGGLAAGAGCLLTNSLDDRSRDLGTAPAVEAGAGSDAGVEAGGDVGHAGGGVSFCSARALAVFCDDFDRTTALSTGWEGLNTEGTGFIDFDDTWSRTGTRSIRVGAKPHGGHSTAFLSRTVDFPSGRLHVALDLFFPVSGGETMETLVLRIAFSDTTSIGWLVGGDFGVRIVDRGPGGYLETAATRSPVAGAWIHADFHFDRDAATFALELDSMSAIVPTKLKSPPSAYRTSTTLAIGLVDAYPESRRESLYNVDSVIVTDE
jgi:hypothetical protein